MKDIEQVSPFDGESSSRFVEISREEMLKRFPCIYSSRWSADEIIALRKISKLPVVASVAETE